MSQFGLRTYAMASFDSFMRGLAPNGYSFARHTHALRELRDAITAGDAASAWLWGRVLARLGRMALEATR